MKRNYLAAPALTGALLLALLLTGCGNGKKGNGYIAPVHLSAPAALVTRGQ